MKLNRKWLLAIALVLSLTMAVGGTLAFLTDRDSEANVFTMGNVEIDLTENFNQGAELIPGVDIEKKPIITNTGNTDAWVWATIAIPAALDNEDASKNVVHFNYAKESVGAGLWNWQGDGDWMIETVEKDGVDYNVYTVLYQSVLEPGASTPAVMTKVYMDDHIDIDPDGNLHHVEKGVVTDIDWNINEDGNPIIYVSAYAMQTNEFDSVLDAYKAYNVQWTTEDGVNNGIEWGNPVAPVDTAAELNAALKKGGNVVLNENITIPEGEQILVPADSTATLDLNGKNISSASNSYGIRAEGNLTITGSGKIEGSFGALGAYGNAVVNIDSVELVSKGYQNSSSHSIYTSGNSIVTLTNVKVHHNGEGADGSVLYAAGSSKVTINGNSEFTWSGSAYTLAAAGNSTVTINGGTFQNNNFFSWGGTITDNRSNSNN